MSPPGQRQVVRVWLTIAGLFAAGIALLVLAAFLAARLL